MGLAAFTMRPPMSLFAASLNVTVLMRPAPLLRLALFRRSA